MTLGKSLAGLAAIVTALTLSTGKAQAQQPEMHAVPVYGVSAATRSLEADTLYLGQLEIGENFTVPSWRTFEEFILVEPNAEYEVSMRGIQPTTSIDEFMHGSQRRSAEVYSAAAIRSLSNDIDPAVHIADVNLTRTRMYCENDCIENEQMRLIVPNPDRTVIMERVIKDMPIPEPLPELPSPPPPELPPPPPQAPPVVYVPPPPQPPPETWDLGWIGGGLMGLFATGSDDRYCPPCEEFDKPSRVLTRSHELEGLGGWAMGGYRSPAASVHGLAEMAKGEYILAGEDCFITDTDAQYSRLEGSALVGLVGSDDVRFGVGAAGHRTAINRSEPLGNRGDLEQGYSARAGVITPVVTPSIGYGKYSFTSDLTGAEWDGTAIDARLDADIQLGDRLDLYLMGSAAKLSTSGSVRGTTVTDDGSFSFTPGEEVDASGYRFAGEALLGVGLTDNLQLAGGVGLYSRTLETGDERYSNNLSMVLPRIGLRLTF